MHFGFSVELLSELSFPAAHHAQARSEQRGIRFLRAARVSRKYMSESSFVHSRKQFRELKDLYVRVCLQRKLHRNEITLCFLIGTCLPCHGFDFETAHMNSKRLCATSIPVRNTFVSHNFRDNLKCPATVWPSKRA